MDSPSTTPSAASLPACPGRVEGPDGTPRFGSYLGSLESSDFGRLAGPYALGLRARVAKEKRWVYTFVATPEVMALVAILDLSYTASAFATVLSLKDRRVLVDESYLGLPGPFGHVNDRPGEGLEARFRRPGASLSVSRPPRRSRYQVRAELSPPVPLAPRSLLWDGNLLAEGGAPALTVIAPVSEDGVVNVTQKAGGLLCFGTLEAGGRRFLLDGGVGGIDYTHGLLARRTAWRWAFAQGRLEDGTPVGLNLVEGFNESRDEVNENALWLGARLVPLARARFSFNPRDSLDEWKVETVDGAVDLRLRPLAVHREERDLRWVKSRFVQPLGLYEGSVLVDGKRLQLSGIPGVAEDQDTLW